MSLTVVMEPSVVTAKNANELSPGTWFMDVEGQVYIIAIDDRTNEKRVLCAGNFYRPFIVNVPLKEFEVKKVLQIGTLLQICATTNYGDSDE